MALCESILDLMQDQARSQGFGRVTAVHLEIGRLAGVEIGALRFGFDVVTRGSLAEGARLEIEEADGKAWCLQCCAPVEIGARVAPCPRCGSHQLQVTGGDQMRLKELQVE